MDFLKACVNDSVLDISSEKISEPASIVKGVSSPKLFAMPMLQRKKSTIFVEFADDLRESSLASAWLSADQNGATSNLAFSDHLQNNTCRSSCLRLPKGQSERRKQSAREPDKLTCPTIPCEILRGSKLSSRPRPLMCECAPIRSMRVRSFTS